MSGIFISYRRNDSPDATGRIYDRLVSEFGKAQVFKDVDSIPLGQDFRGHVNGIVGECGVVLAIIGPRWTDARNQEAQRRLDDPDDFVRIELEAGLARDIPVVPVLVGHAPIPGPSELPASLAPMAFRQAIEVRPDPDFHNDATRLVAALQVILDPNAPGTQASSGAKAAGGPPLKWILAFTASALVAAVLAIPAMKYLREAPTIAAPEMRTDIVTPATDDPGSFALSPDGRQIVFVASDEDGSQRLWLRTLSATSAKPLAGTEGAYAPFWSPDSGSVGFFAKSQLQRLDLGGGAPRALAAVSNAQGGAWNAEGIIVFGASAGAPLSRISATGGSAVAATKLAAKQAALGVPQFLPDGRHFLFTAVGTSPEAQGIYLAALGTTDVQRLTPTPGRCAYLSDWLLCVNQSGNFTAQRLDLKRQTLRGDLVTIADGVDAFSVSPTGLVAYRTGTRSVRRQLTWFDRAGNPQGVLGGPDETLQYPSVSPDGHQAVVSRLVQGNTDIWLFDGARTNRLTFDPAFDSFPVWSPDGHSIAFSSAQSGFLDLYRQAVDGSGTSKLLVASPQAKILTDWSRDGRFLLYFSQDPQTQTDLWVLPMTGSQKPWVFLKTPFDEAFGQFSPDGRFVAYQSNESGRYEIYIRPFAPPGEATTPTGGQWQISTGGGLTARWSPDGRQLYYLDPQGRMMAVSITVTGAAVAPGTPVPLFAMKILPGGMTNPQNLQYGVARDGRFLINAALEKNGTATPITLMQNWQPPGK